MEKTHRSPRGDVLANTRGAAFLLSVYLVSLTLLLLGGVSLQRTTTEVRAAQLSRDLQQSFWLAESALDAGLVRLRTQRISDSTTPISTDLSGATFTVTTVGSEVVSPETQRLVRLITATGTTSGHSTQLSVIVSEEKPLQGVWSNGPIYAIGFNEDMSTVVQGDLRTGLGTASGIVLRGGLPHNGTLQIGPPAPARLSRFFLSTNDPWQRPIGNNGRTDGVYLLEGAATTATQPVVALLPTIQPQLPPYAPAQCASDLTILTGGPREIQDGDPLDLTGPEDGKIEMCLHKLTIDTRDGVQEVTFGAPTTIYVSAGAILAGEIYAVEPGHLVPASAPLAPLRLIVSGGKVFHLFPSRFLGSIFAPNSHVEILGGGDEELYYNSLVGKEIALIGYGGFFDGGFFRFNGPPTTDQSSSTPDGSTNLLSWTAGAAP